MITQSRFLAYLLGAVSVLSCVQTSQSQSVDFNAAVDDCRQTDGILTNASGVQLCLPSDVTDIVTQHLSLYGWWQPHLSMFMDALLASCPSYQCTFLDVGAKSNSRLGQTISKLHPFSIVKVWTWSPKIQTCECFRGFFRKAPHRW